jgi:glycosyltransferase involved in cell wall biosynthesis
VNILICSEVFPNPFKGYIDTQAAEFVRLGGRVSFAALDDWGRSVHGRLAAAQSTVPVTYVPGPGALRGSLGPILRGMASSPVRSLGLLYALRRRWGLDRRAVGDWGRGVVMGRPQVDVCLVHNLRTLLAFRVLADTLPDGVPVVLWYHGGEVPGTDPIYPDLARQALSTVTHVVTNTRYTAEHIAARGMDPSRIAIHPLGLYPDDFPYDESRRFRSTGPLRILYVGRLSPEKGLMDAVEALASLESELRSQLQFRLVGNGPQREELEAATDRLGLGSIVTFAGYKPHETLKDELGQADLLILPSKPAQTWEENQGTVLQEAMLTGLPVLTTFTGGMPEVVPPSVRDRLVPPGDPSALADAFRAYLAFDADEWTALSTECATFAKERFDIRFVTEPVYRLLERLAGA